MTRRLCIHVIPLGQLPPSKEKEKRARANKSVVPTDAGIRCGSPFCAVMVEPVKKRRLLQAYNESSRSTGSQTSANTAHLAGKGGEEGRMDGSILRLAMKNFL